MYNGTVQKPGAAPVYIVNGIGGCREGNSLGIDPNTAPPWRVVGYERLPGSSENNNLFGFGLFHIEATALTWTMYSDNMTTPIDSFTMTPRSFL